MNREQVWPCDKLLCFREAKWIILNMPPITAAQMEDLGLGDAEEMLHGHEDEEAVLRVLVPAAGRLGATVEIRCDKHADVSVESIARSPRRLPIPIERYIRLFGFPRIGR